MEIAAWLRGLGLEQYEAAFRANDIALAFLNLPAGIRADVSATLTTIAFDDSSSQWLETCT